MSHGRQRIDNRFILQDFYRVLAPEGVILASHSGPCERSLKSNRDFRRSAPLAGCAEMPQLRNRRRRAFWLVTTCASRNRSRSVRRRNTIAGLAARACQFPDAATREVRRSASRRDRAVLHGTSLLDRRMQGSLVAAPPPRRLRHPDPQLRLLGPDFSADRGSEQFTVFTVESRHLHLLDRKIVGRASIDLDARKQQPEFEILRLAACRMTFSRVSSSPHCLST